MSVCTFFGHHDCPAEVKEKLRNLLIDLIENRSVDTFYVGNQGMFDQIVRSILHELKINYPGIRYAVVLAYMPNPQDTSDDRDYTDTILPDDIEEVPKRFAIFRRNQWMLRRSDIVITYIRHSWGGAARFAELAERQKKEVIHL